MLKRQACREITHSHSALLAADFSPHQVKISIKNLGVRWYYWITIRIISVVFDMNFLNQSQKLQNSSCFQSESKFSLFRPKIKVFRFEFFSMSFQIPTHFKRKQFVYLCINKFPSSSN